MRFGTLTDHLADEKGTAIDRAAELGFDGIELVIPDGIHDVGAHGMALVTDHPPVEDDPVWSPSERARLRERAASQELAISSLCPSFMNMQSGLISASSADRAVAREYLGVLVQAAADLAAKTILVPFFVDAEIADADDRARVVDALRELAPAAEEADVTLAIETTLDAEDNRAIVDAVDSPAVAVYYDVANVLNYGFDPAEEIRVLGDDIQQVHFKDHAEDGTHAMLGDGQVDFEAVAAALRDIGYDGWISLETSYESDPVETMAENLAFARELMAQHAE